MKEFAKAVLELLKEVYSNVEWSFSEQNDCYYFDLNDGLLYSDVLDQLKDFTFSVMVVGENLTICLYC